MRMRKVLVLLLGAFVSAAPRDQTAPSWPVDVGFGQHRALIRLDDSLLVASTAETTGTGTSTEANDAVWVDVPWHRRAVPDADNTSVILTVASTGAVIANVLGIGVAVIIN